MKESDIVSTLTVRFVAEGEGAVVTASNVVSAAQEKLLAQLNALATASETTARRQASSAAAVAALASKIDPATRAAAELEAVQVRLSRALGQGVVSVERANEILDVYTQKANAAAVASEKLRREQSNISTNTSVANTGNPTQITGAQLSNVNVREYAAQFEAAAAAQDAMVASMARLRAEMNPLEVEQGRLGAEMATYKAALDSGKMSLATYTAEQDKAGQALAAYADKINTAAVAAENLRRQQSNLSTNTTVAGPTNPTQITGTQLSNVDTRNYAAQFEAAAKAQDDMVASATRLRTAINPLEAEQGRLAGELRNYKVALDAGRISQTEFATAHEMAGKRLADFAQNLKVAGTAGRVMSGEMTNLGYQLNDVITGLALGQSPFMIIAQQGGQIVQVFANSKASIADFGSSAITWLKSLASTMNVVTAAAAAVGTAIVAVALSYDKAQVSANKSIMGAGAATGTTITDLNKFAQQNSGSIAGGNLSTGLSTKESRALGEELTQTGQIVVSRLHDMSNAVVGFANQSNKSMEDARKVFVDFATDPKRAIEELEKAFGPLDSTTKKTVDEFLRLGDKTGALQSVIDGLGDKSLKAAENMSTAERAARALVNALATHAAPQGLESQLEAVKGKLNTAIQEGSSAGTGEAAAAASANIERLSREFERLQAAKQAEMAINTTAEFERLAAKAGEAAQAITPEIDQLEKLRTKLAELEAAKAAGATSKYGAAVDNAAITAIENLIAKTVELQAQTARHNEMVKEVGASWQGVGQETALALQAAQNQLPVIQAVDGATKMAAQSAADYKNAIIEGKTATEAAAIAASNLRTAQAAAVASAQQQTAELQKQNELLAAGIGLEGAAKTEAQGRILAAQKYDDILKATGSQQTAMNASRAVERNTDLRVQEQQISAAGQLNGAANGYEATQIAIEQKQRQILLNNAQWMQDMFTFGSEARKLAGYFDQADSAIIAMSDSLEAAATKAAPFAGKFDADPALTTHEGNTASTLPFIIPKNRDETLALFGVPPAKPPAATTDLKNSIEKLTTSTDRLNTTNQELLSPFYTQDPRTSHIGYRSQGMASGGSFTVPGGYSSNDNVMMTMPLASGEVVDVHRGERSTQPIIITQNITIQGSASRDDVGRTMYQNGQTLGRTVRAAGS